MNFFGNPYVGTFRMTLSTAHFWFTLFLTIVILIVPIVAIRFYYVDTHPTLSDRVRLRQRLSHLRTRPSEPTLRISSVRRSSRRSIRSGYAFAHQEGFGRLIMSGKIMKKSKSNTFCNNLHGTPKAQNHHWVNKTNNSREKGSPSTVEVWCSYKIYYILSAFLRALYDELHFLITKPDKIILMSAVEILPNFE